MRGVNATSVPCYLPSLKNRLCDLIRVNSRRANLGSALTASEGFSFSIICMFTSFFLQRSCQRTRNQSTVKSSSLFHVRLSIVSVVVVVDAAVVVVVVVVCSILLLLHRPIVQDTSSRQRLKRQLRILVSLLL